MNFLAVFLGGGLGSLARYSLGLAIKRLGFMAPIGTLASNILATAMLLGLIAAYSKSPEGSTNMNTFYLLWTVGFCGAFSTFSTFAADTISLHSSHGLTWAMGNIAVNVTFCIALGWLIWSSIEQVH